VLDQKLHIELLEMKKILERIKAEFYELLGTLSVEELVLNLRAVFEDFSRNAVGRRGP
jgi:hypothetical protein